MFITRLAPLAQHRRFVFDRSMVPVWRDVVRDQGVMGLAKGLSARVPRLFLSQAIQFSLVDIFKAMLQKY